MMDAEVKLLEKLTLQDESLEAELNISNGEEALDGEEFNKEEEYHKWSAVHRYEEEWHLLCRDARDRDDLGELRRRALLGSLRASRFRSVSWRLLLRLLPPDPEAWVMVLHDQREHYMRLSTLHHVSPALTENDNPLSQDTQSLWHQYFCNKELQAVIRQDVVRTFPGIDFFRERSVQDKMVAILFCYARANPDMCYRQGMHEILAPLMFVLHSDHQALMHTREHAPVSKEIISVLDPQHLEADAYTLFCRIMSGIESCYRINDVQPTSTGQFPYQQEKRGQESELMSQLTHIRDTLLVPSDPQLAQHLQRLDIPLTLFGIRWLRLLFGREFPLQDLLVLWDAIFAEAEGGNCFELVNFIVVAMLIAIRHQLLTGDYTTCLTYLMRYPGAVDISYIIEHSLYLKNPEKYCAPATVSFPNLPVITIGGRNDMNRGPVNLATLPQQHMPPQARQDPKLKEKKNKTTNKKKGDGALSKRLGKFSSGRWGKQPRAESTEETIVEGFSLDDPVLIPTELQKAVQLIRSTQLNLSTNLATLDAANIAADPAVRDALDGIRQVVLDLSSFHSLALEVEPALEAGEIRSSTQQVKQPGTPPPHHTPPPPSSIVKLDVFKTSLGIDDNVIGAPLPNPLNTESS